MALHGWDSRPWFPSVLMGLLLFPAVFWTMRRISLKYARFLSSRVPSYKRQISHSLLLTLLPLLLLFLEFLPYLVVLKDIRGLLMPLAVLGILVLNLMLFLKLFSRDPLKFPLVHKLERRFSLCDLRKLTGWLVGSSLIVYLLLASGLIFPAHPLTGDEPHYLVLTQSILEDGDIDVANNYSEQKYRIFYPGEIEAHADSPRKHPGRQYSRHLPGLSIILVPAYFIAERISGMNSRKSINAQARRRFIFIMRIPLCVLTALLGGLFFWGVNNILQNRRWAFAAWIFFGFTAPVLFFSHLIYPEIPAAIITLGIYMGVMRKTWHSKFSAVLLGMGIAALPWLGSKFLVVAFVLGGIAAVRLCRNTQRPRSAVLLFLVPGLVSGGLFLLFLWTSYGSLSPLSIYRGAIPGREMGLSWYFSTSVTQFLSHGLGILLDQRVGLLPYAPLCILFFPGLVILGRKLKQETRSLALILASYWILHAWSRIQEGFCPPGRHLLALFWIIAVFVAAAAAEARGRWPSMIVKAGMVMNMGIVILTIANPRFLYHNPARFTTTPQAERSHLLTSLSNSLIDLRNILPNFTDPRRIDWTGVGISAGVILSIAGIFLIKKFTTKKGSRSLGLSSFLVLAASAVILGYVFFDIHLDRPVTYPAKDFTLYFQDARNFGPELDGFWTKGGEQTGILIETGRPLHSLEIRISSQVPGRTNIQVGGTRRSVAREYPHGLSASLTFPAPKGFPWGRSSLYFVKIHDPADFVPHVRDGRQQDNRRLGIFVQINTRDE